MSASPRFLNRLWALLEFRHLLAEVASIAQGEGPGPDLPSADRVVEQTTDDVVSAQAAGWIWDLVRLAEELEHVAVWGMISPRGTTAWRYKDLDAVKLRIQEISLDLVFYRRILEQAADLRPPTPLMERILDEISRAMEGPGYVFREFRQELMEQAREYEATRGKPNDEANLDRAEDVGHLDDRDVYPAGYQEADPVDDDTAADGEHKPTGFQIFSVPLISPELFAQLQSSTNDPTMHIPGRTVRVFGDGGPVTRGAMLLEFLGTGLAMEDRLRIAEEADEYVYSILKQRDDAKAASGEEKPIT